MGMTTILGSNLSLKDGKLIVELPQILKVLEKASDKLKKLDVRFEPLENGSNNERLGKNNPQFIPLLPLVDAFRTANWASIKSELQFSGILPLCGLEPAMLAN